jgi:hypothetical protein
MTAQTNVYFFKQRQQVVLWESGSAIATRGYQIVYSKELFLNKGVDNIIEIAVVNQDQKTVNLTGKQLTFRILDRELGTVLFKKLMTPVLPVTGLTSIVVNTDELDSVPVQQCYYTIEATDSNNTFALGVDSAGRTRGVLNIMNGVTPGFIPCHEVTIPTHSIPTTYYSSEFGAQKKKSFTVQIFMDNFTGNAYLQGSTVSDFSIPYELTPKVDYTAVTGTQFLAVEGTHPYIRMAIENQGTIGSDGLPHGDVVRIIYR